MQKNSLDRWKDITEIVKNIGNIAGVAFVLGIIIITSPDIRVITNRLSEFAGLKLYNEINTPERLTGQDEISVTTALRQAAELLGMESEDVWIYAGATVRDTKTPWIEANINSPAVPLPGDAILAATDVFVRAREPRFIQGEWLKGEIQGVLSKGERVVVKNIFEIHGVHNTSLWWIEVSRGETASGKK